MTNKTEHHGKQSFVDIAYKASLAQKYSNITQKTAYHTKSVLLPQENACINFQNFKRLTKAQFHIYDYFECVLIPSTDNIDFGSNTKKYQHDIVCSYC